tara:strand:+ start:4054 stop:4689 length:636 start_codon:yes stop_codon:yes gene_type:complete
MSFTVEQENRSNNTATQAVQFNRTAYGNRWSELSDYDRELYGTRFNLLASGGRMNDTSTTNSVRPFRAADSYWHVPGFGMLFTIPSHLPGSNNKTSSSGTTIADRGGLVCRSYGQDALVEFGMRIVTLDGSGGLATVGTYVRSQSTHGGTAGWLTSDTVGGASNILLYPSGASAGDLIEVYVAFRTPTVTVTPAYLMNWEIFEPDLGNANP